jgi:hypothetical protein
MMEAIPEMHQGFATEEFTSTEESWKNGEIVKCSLCMRVCYILWHVL